VIGPYQTPQAFRAALDTRLRNIAQSRGTDLQRLQRSVAFERLLARLFARDDPPWLLKGGYALELRLEDRARSTLDLDVSVPDPARLQSLAAGDEAATPLRAVYEHLGRAAGRNLSDGFDFLIRRPKGEQTGAPGGGIRCSVEARLAGRAYARFHLDVGLGDAVLGQPEWIDGSPLLDFAGIPAPRVALYPVEQQFAEKVHAYTFPWQARVNTRVKDLVDLVLLVDSDLLDPDHVRQAVAATFDTRKTHQLPTQLPEPPIDWSDSYAALARELGLPVLNLESAYTYLETYWQMVEQIP
jgi:predicted nucleotidyltransferase component of viral defense system